MKQRTIGKWLFFLLCVCTMSWTPVYATSTQTTIVSYDPTQIEYKLEIQVSGNGQIQDGNQSIREGIVQYTFLEETMKTFMIQPDPGYHIGSIQLSTNGQSEEEVMDQLIAGKLTIDVKAVMMKLHVKFEKDAESTSSPSSPSSPKPGSEINTGDKSDLKMLMAWLGGSLILIMILQKEKHHNVYKSNQSLL